MIGIIIAFIFYVLANILTSIAFIRADKTINEKIELFALLCVLNSIVFIMGGLVE